MIELIAGAGIAAFFSSVGFMAGRHARKTVGPPPEICQCGHGSAYHDRAGCHHTVKGQILRYDGYSEPIRSSGRGPLASAMGVSPPRALDG